MVVIVALQFGPQVIGLELLFSDLSRIVVTAIICLFWLIIDEVVPDLVEAITSDYVLEGPGEDTEGIIKRNRMHRKYPWAH